MSDSRSAQNPFPGPPTLDGYQRISGTCSEGDLIRLRTGNLIRHVTLVDVATVGMPLQFLLIHNSQSRVHGALGHRWQSNLMAALDLSDVGSGQVTFISSQGRQFDFVFDTEWKLDGGSYFYRGKLQPVGADWRIVMPDGAFQEFDSGGLLQRLVDRHGNATTLDYSSSGIVVTEPEGRTLTLTYKSSTTLVETVEDPMGNVSTLTYDAYDNLVEVQGPAGCLLTYGYATPSNHLITSRTDARNQTHAYTYVNVEGGPYNDPDGVAPALLSTVTDPEDNTLTYSYEFDPDTREKVGRDGFDAIKTFHETRLEDARSQVWVFRFDDAGNLWRIINPLGHHRRFFWSPEQKLLCATGGYTNQQPGELVGPTDNLNNSAWRAIYDDRARLLLEADATGLVNQYEYNDRDLVERSYAGRAHLGIQGNWRDHFGLDDPDPLDPSARSFLLCAFQPDGSSLASLPSYVDDVSLTTGAPLHLPLTGGLTLHWPKLIDPRIPDTGTSVRREAGYWYQDSDPGQDAEMVVTITLQQAASFNLSVYTNSTDMAQVENDNTSYRPLQYHEQFGRELVLEVEDANETQSLHLPNNAPGYWATFPVQGDATHPIVLRVVAPQPPGAGGTNVVRAQISALAFDPFESRQRRFVYDEETGDLLQAVDPLGNAVALTWEVEGRLSTLTTTVNSTPRTFQFFYEDPDEDGFKELTRLVDPLGGEVRVTRDLNGNVVSVRDALLHTTGFEYDEKDRLVEITDALNQVTRFDHDPAGNLWKVTDAVERVTELLYTACNRLWKIRRPLGDPLQQEVVLGWDESGNLAAVTDPKGETTGFEMDGAGRVLTVVHPDTARSGFAYDALDRLVAFTPPNGNQVEDLEAINVLGAPNLLLNRSAEEDEPGNPGWPRYWQATAGVAATRDCTTAPPGGGSCSLRTSSYGPATDWYQPLPNLYPGVPLLTRFWGRVADAANPNLAQGGARFPPSDGSPPPGSVSPTATDPTAEYEVDWGQFPLLRSAGVPGDAQITATQLGAARFGAVPSVGTAKNIWVDLGEVWGLGTALRYDRQGRLSRLWTPDNATVRLQHDRFGRLVRHVDAQGRVTRLAWDALDRLVRVVDPEGHETLLAWDEVGRLARVTDARGSVTRYFYDDCDRLTEIRYPDDSRELFTWYANGLLKTYKDNATTAPAILCEFFYDDVDRLVRIEFPGDNTEILFEYDAVGNVTSRSDRN